MTDIGQISRLQRWERAAEAPLLLFAAAFFVAYAWPVVDEHTDRGLEDFFTAVSWTVWGVFALDFAVRIILAPHRAAYVRQHWYDVALIALPMLRPLRLLRLLAFLRILNRSAATSLAGRAVTYVIGTAIVSIGVGAVAALDVERDAHGATITSIGDALWWATTTVTTVGYGDVYPVTTQGRLVGVALMIVGIAVVGVVAASLAAWLLSHVQPTPPEDGGTE